MAYLQKGSNVEGSKLDLDQGWDIAPSQEAILLHGEIRNRRLWQDPMSKLNFGLWLKEYVKSYGLKDCLKSLN